MSSLLFFTLYACGPADVAPVYNGLNAQVQLINVARFGETLYTDPLHQIQHFDLSVHELSLKASGPAQVNLGNGTGADADLVDTSARVPGLSLQTGVWTELSMTLRTGPIAIEGQIDGLNYAIQLPLGLVLSGQANTLSLPDGADITVYFELQPHLLWRQIKPESLNLTDNTLFIDSTHNAALIAPITQNLLDGLWVRFPGDANAPTYNPQVSAATVHATETGVSDFSGTPNTGADDLPWRVEASAWAVGHQVGPDQLFETQYQVALTQPSGLPISGADVQMQSLHFGRVSLNELPDLPGVYQGDDFGYGRTISLSVRHDGHQLEATAVGPRVHQISPITGSHQRANPLTIRWQPVEDDVQTRVQSLHYASSLLNDTGDFTLPGEVLSYTLGRYGEERLTVERLQRLELALPRSSFTVGVRSSLDDIDVIDSRLGAISGELGVSDELSANSGPGWISATPRLGDATPWHWLRVDSPAEQDHWQLDGLEPGEWTIIYYLDNNESDDGFPLGPDDEEPLSEHTVTLGPGESTLLDLFIDVP